MKKKYEKPELEITEFDTVDIITTSDGGNGGIDLPEDENGFD